ncbi:MAG TPA: hypothetical protein VH370_02070 [Humisphaera sp.]|jgi:hypothetical protein|nr:hypothetical protein [Humisphaera sp.]
MRNRGLRISVLIFAALWFGVLLPVHTRGQIALPGDQSACEQAHSCCASSHEGHPTPDAPRKSHSCAVCYLIATLDLPAPMTVNAPPPTLAGLVRRDTPRRIVSHTPLLTCSERGPPFSV